MKTIKHTIFIILLCVGYNAISIAQNLDSMPAEKRDSLLTAIAKEIILKYGPDYYREDFKPVIERHSIPPKGEINKTGEMAGRGFYWVVFSYDETKERLNESFAAKVQVWADTGKPSGVLFGNGLGIIVDENNLRNSEEIEPILYQQRHVVAIYDLDDPDPNRDPKNLAELQQRGYVKQSNGQWIKTTPDTPPAEAQRVIRRALEEIKRKAE